MEDKSHDFFDEFRVRQVKRDLSINLAQYVRSCAVLPGVSCTKAGDGGVTGAVVEPQMASLGFKLSELLVSRLGVAV